MKTQCLLKRQNLLPIVLIVSGVSLVAQTDTVPPSIPAGLTATVANCGQVNLSWNASTDNAGGSGMEGYTINRYDTSGVNTAVSIGSVRTTYADTNFLKSSSTVTYSVVAFDNAGNRSAPSGSLTVTTPACPTAIGEQILDSTNMDALGKTTAAYGSLTALIYTKQNQTIPSNLDTWINLRDSSTGQTSAFILHTSPGYRQIETDYVLTGSTELWTLSYDANFGGHILASQYRLNNSPSTSATLLSTKAMGDVNSSPKSMILLKSGALMMAWNEEANGYTSSDGSLTTGFAYRSSAGAWTVNFPLSIPNPYGGNTARTQMAMAQHPADNSIWAFAKRDTFTQINALHFTETTNGFVVDWINTGYITVSGDGNNGPEVEFPFLAATSDPTRNSILLAYQSHPYQIVFIDSLFNIMNSIYLKESNAVIAQIGANGSKSFIPFPASFSRASQFGFSVLTDGTIWVTYQPIDHTALTWNQVYAAQYVNNVWSAPTLVGMKYMTVNSGNAARDPGFIVSQAGQPQVAFWTPDQKLHEFVVSNSPQASVSDTTPPTTSITSPASGSTVSGTMSVAATAADNIGVARVDLQVDGVVTGSLYSAPFTFTWATGGVVSGSHTLQTAAYDAAGNKGTSAPVTVTVGSTADTIPPVVTITSPASGAVVARGSTINVTAAATDNVGVARVQFYLNNTLMATDTSGPYTWSWKVPAKNNVSYTIKVVAYDAAGNSASATSTVLAQ